MNRLISIGCFSLALWLAGVAGDVRAGELPFPLFKSHVEADFWDATHFANSFGYELLELDGDEWLDLVSLHPIAGLEVRHGMGDFRFGPPINLEEGTDRRDIEAVEVNGDGLLDLVYLSGDSVLVRLQDGTGGFSEPVDSGLAGWNALDDFDGDGLADVALTSLVSQNSVSIRYGAGDGTFPLGIDHNLASAPVNVRAGDVDGINGMDLVGQMSDRKIIQPVLNGGERTFTNGTSTTFPVNVSDFDLLNANNDARADLVVCMNTQPTIRVLLGNASGGFDAFQEITLEYPVTEIRAADAHGDARDELVFLGVMQIRILEASEVGTFELLFANHAHADVLRLDPGFVDLDGDGLKEFHYSNNDTGMFAIWPGDADEIFLSERNLVPPECEVYCNYDLLNCADFDEDGRDDLASGHYDFNIDLAIDGNGIEFERNIIPFDDWLGFDDMAIGHFDQDEHQDIITRTLGGYVRLDGNGDGTFDLSPTDPVSRRMTSQDMDNDGFDDIVGFNYIPNTPITVSVHFGTGKSTFTEPLLLPLIFDPPPLPPFSDEVVYHGDFNGDSLVDIAFSLTESRAGVFPGTGNRTFGAMIPLVGGDHAT